MRGRERNLPTIRRPKFLTPHERKFFQMTVLAPAPSALASLIAQIGNTALVPLQWKGAAQVFGKNELTNPAGSIKDRPALYMIEQAEREGLLKPGGIIVEGSSGNMGAALAMIGRLKGYRVIVTVSDKTSPQKLQVLKAYGAEVHTCPAVSSHEDPRGYWQTARRLAEELGAFMPNQFYNPANAEAHYHGLGPEIWRQTAGKITHFVAAAGTGGTLSGVGRFLKEKNPAIKIYGVDTATSFYSTKGNHTPYAAEAFGLDNITPLINLDVIDEIIPLSDEEIFESTRRVCREDGFLVGFSTGAAAAVARRLAETGSSRDLIVFPFCDSGKPYLQKLFG